MAVCSKSSSARTITRQPKRSLQLRPLHGQFFVSNRRPILKIAVAENLRLDAVQLRTTETLVPAVDVEAERNMLFFLAS
jgi:hypothetical protein